MLPKPSTPAKGYSYLLFWWAVAMVVGIALTRFIAPFQSPDENAHHLRAAMLANGQLLLQPSGHGVRDSGWVDENFAAYADSAARMRPYRPDKDPTAREGLHQIASQLHWAGNDVLALAPGTGYYTPVLYIPHVAAIWIAKRLNLSMVHTYELTRVFVITTALSIAFYACWVWQPNVLMLMVLLTPISLFQWYSATVDGLAGALLLLLLALWLRLMNAGDRDRSLHHEAMVYAIVLVLCTTRTHLLPTLLIPATLLIRHFTWKRLLALTLLTLAVLGWQAFAASVSGQHFLNRKHSTRELISIYAANPLEFLDLLGRTFQNEQRQSFYRQGFVGLLGWSDVPLGGNRVRTVYHGLLAALVVTVWVGLPWRRREWGMRFSAVVMSVSSILIAFLALAVSWNDYPVNTIDGIQGRYLIPVAVILAFGIGPLGVARPYRWPERLLLLLFVPYSLYETTKLLLAYYYLNPFDALLG